MLKRSNEHMEAPVITVQEAQAESPQSLKNASPWNSVRDNLVKSLSGVRSFTLAEEVWEYLLSPLPSVSL